MNDVTKHASYEGFKKTQSFGFVLELPEVELLWAWVDAAREGKRAFSVAEQLQLAYRDDGSFDEAKVAEVEATFEKLAAFLDSLKAIRDES